MDSRIWGIVEKMTKDVFKLAPTYASKAFSATTKTIAIVMSNGLIDVQFKYPTELIKDHIEVTLGIDPETMFDSTKSSDVEPDEEGMKSITDEKPIKDDKKAAVKAGLKPHLKKPLKKST